MTTFGEQILAQHRAKRLAMQQANTGETPIEKPVERIGISEASKRTGISRDTIYRTWKAGFVKGDRPSPKKILIDFNDLKDFLVASASPGFWTPERRVRYSGKAVG